MRAIPELVIQPPPPIEISAPAQWPSGPLHAASTARCITYVLKPGCNATGFFSAPETGNTRKDRTLKAERARFQDYLRQIRPR